MECITKIRNKLGSEVKAGFFYTLGNFFLKGVTFITLPIYTRLLSTSEYGVYSLYNSWMGIITIIVGLSLGSSISIAKDEFKEEYNKYLSSILSLSLISLGCILAIVVMFNSVIGSLTMLPLYLNIILILNSYNMFVIFFMILN